MEHLLRNQDKKGEGKVNIESLKMYFIIIKYCRILLKIDMPWSKENTGKNKHKYHN